MVGNIFKKIKAAKEGHSFRETAEYAFSVMLAKALSAFALSLISVLKIKYKKPARSKGAERRLGLVIPVMPDLSHHFIYREVFQLLEQFDLKLFVIFQGDKVYETPITETLSKSASYYPHVSRGRAVFYFSFIKRFFRSPLKVCNLLLFYRDYLIEGKSKFITFGAVRDYCHPLFGFVLADMMEGQDVSHIHAYCSNISTNHAIVAAHLLDKSLSFTGYVDFDFEYSFKMLKEKVALGDFMVVHTEFCKKRMVSYVGEEFEDKINVVRIGLDFDSIKRDASESFDKSLRLLAICGLVEKKGLKYLIDACSRIREEVPDFRLYIIGDGPLKESLVKQTRLLKLEDRIIFVGGLPNERVFEYLTEESILVMPSVYTKSRERDGIPTVIIEAMAKGVNVISTNVSGIPEVLINEMNGLMVEPEDSKALADAILRLYKDKQLFNALRENGRPKVMEMFDVRKNADNLAQLLDFSLKT